MHKALTYHGPQAASLESDIGDAAALASVDSVVHVETTTIFGMDLRTRDSDFADVLLRLWAPLQLSG